MHSHAKQGSADPIPVSVVISTMAIAAGFCGRSVTVVFDEYDAALACHLWRRLLGGNLTSNVLHIRGTAELRKLEKASSGFRLVIVHSSGFLSAVNWTLQFDQGGLLSNRPAVFTLTPPDDLDDDPATPLFLRADALERALLVSWCSTHDSEVPKWDLIATQTGTQLREQIQHHVDLLVAATPLQKLQWREKQLVANLIAGGCVVRGQATDDSVLQVYQNVRSVLESPIVGADRRLGDQLATAMVSRANLYLSIKFGDDQSDVNPFAGQRYDIPCGSRRPKRELITRRELADLGNVNSKLVRNIIEYLKQSADGETCIAEMGVTRECSNFRKMSAESLSSRLLSWSAKQVRTAFDRMQREGLITAERPAANGPWFYCVPESLSHVMDPFRQLPTAAELKATVAT